MGVGAIGRRGRETGRARRAVIAVSLIAIASCTNSAHPASAPELTTEPAASSSARLSRISVLTALGDSVPYGTACKCTPYPQLTATEIAASAKHEVRAFNDAVSGFLTTDVLRQLQHDATAIADVKAADVVAIEIGANDIAFSSTCGTTVVCYESDLSRVAGNITAIVSRVRQLTAGRHIAVVLLDYWSVWLGGQYARARGAAYVDAAASLTGAFSTSIRADAMRTGSMYVDLRTAFRGPDHDQDETSLLAADGDHPNAEGHERIAATIFQTLATS